MTTSWKVTETVLCSGCSSLMSRESALEIFRDGARKGDLEIENRRERTFGFTSTKNVINKATNTWDICGEPKRRSGF